MTGTLIVITIVNSGSRKALYLTITFSLIVLLLIALKFSLSGKYILSARITVATIVFAPWIPILIDKSVVDGDFVPLIFLIAPIQICSLLLSNWATLAIAIFQTLSLSAIIFSSPNLIKLNWTSLFVYVVIVSTLAIISNITIHRQIEELQKRKEQLTKTEIYLRELSMRDSLTGLFNRRHMEESLENTILKGQNFSIIMMDVDKFKKINDEFGHPLGDLVLAKVADILKIHSRNKDVICRFGGDEFIVILEDCSLIEATKKANAFREIVKNTAFYFQDVDVGSVTLSFGVSSFPDSSSSCKEILAAADKALLVAKKEVRNRVVSTIDSVYNCCVN